MPQNSRKVFTGCIRYMYNINENNRIERRKNTCEKMYKKITFLCLRGDNPISVKNRSKKISYEINLF